MEDNVSQAKAEYIRAKEQLVRALATTPDSRINWSPSETSRTPIQLVAHAASAVKSIHGMLDGRPFAIEDTAEADRAFRNEERQFRTREEVLGLLEQHSAAYVAFLDGLTPERLAKTIKLPFGLGSAPLAVGLTFAADHTRGHTAQIDYIQTIYADHDWHMPGA